MDLSSNFSWSALRGLDYFIVGREPVNNLYVDYAAQAGTKLLFGADQQPFRPCRM